MRSVLNGFVRWLVVVIIGLMTFWPNWGVMWLAIQWFPHQALPVTIGGLLWVMILALALPLTLRMFRFVTIAAVVMICGSSLYLAGQVNDHLITSWPWFMWAVLIIFMGFGWWKITTPLWRWANGIVAVQNTNDPGPHHG